MSERVTARALLADHRFRGLAVAALFVLGIGVGPFVQAMALATAEQGLLLGVPVAAFMIAAPTLILGTPLSALAVWLFGWRATLKIAPAVFVSYAVVFGLTRSVFMLW